MVSGSCFCGLVRYEVEAEGAKPSICHCAGCRRASAAPAMAWITVPAAAFRVVAGELAAVRGRSDENGTCDGCGGVRGFCADCGTHITFVGDDRTQEVDVTTCSLEDPNRFAPTEDVFTEAKVAWMKALAT